MLTFCNRLWCNENAGPDGADGGNGAHIVFQASNDVKDFNHLTAVLKGEDGQKGSNKDCHGKNASHRIVKVPIGTIVKNNTGKTSVNNRKSFSNIISLIMK